MLDRFLPTEIVDKIYRINHNIYMREICIILQHKIVWIYSKKEGYMWWVAEKQNYYQCLDE
jgi:hypothetical protein